MGHRSEPFVQPAHIAIAQRHECVEVALRRPAEPDIGARGRRGVMVVDDHEEALAGRRLEAEAFEQPRMGRLRILAPDDDNARTVPDLPQRGGGDAAQRSRRRTWPRAIRRPSGDQSAQAVGEGKRGPGILHGRAGEPLKLRPARASQQLAGSHQRRLDLCRLTVDGCRRRVRRGPPTLGEPARAQLALRPQPQMLARVLDRHVVTQQAAAGTRERAALRHRSAPHRRAQPAIELLARSAREHRHRPTPACRPERLV